ncbi:MAG: glycosyltransferase [Cyanobacteria bacterium P01_F01_bin.150]
MKVAIICSTFLPAHEGVSITLFERLKRLSKDGHSALCLVSSYADIGDIYPNWSDYIGAIFENVTVVPLPSKQWMGVKQERNPSRSSRAMMDEALEEFQPDIIQVEEPERLWTTVFALAGLSYARRHHIPCIASYRTNFIDYIQDYAPWWAVSIGKAALLQLTRWVYNQYSKTLVGSQFISQRLNAWGIKNIDYAPVIGSPLVPNPELMRCPNFFKDNYGLDIDNTVKILLLGRLSPDKNWDFNLRYLPQLNHQLGMEKFTIIIAGQGELESAIRSHSFTQDLSPVMLGEVPHHRVSQLLANVDLHVTSSLKETFGRTVQESLYVGTPVVAPDCDWARNLIKPNVNGLLYTLQDGEDFIKKLTSLIKQPDTRAKLRQNSISVSSQLSIEQDPTYQWVEYLNNQVKHKNIPKNKD